MNSRSVSTLKDRRRSRRLVRVIAAQALLRAAVEDRGERKPRGRAWINGREVGGTDPLYQHLLASHD